MAAFALLCPFLYTSASLASVLNGLGKTQMTLLHNVVSSGLRMIFIVALVPSMGISGYLWGMLASSILLCLLHTIQIGRICGLRFNVVKTLVVPFAGTVLGALCLQSRIPLDFKCLVLVSNSGYRNPMFFYGCCLCSCSHGCGQYSFCKSSGFFYGKKSE